jgi:hypothetical protein
MRHLLLALIALLSFTCVDFAQTRPDMLIYSWQDMEGLLEHHVPSTPSYSFDDLYKDPALHDLAATKDPGIYWEMVAQSKYPFVEMAGLQLLQAQSADSAVDAAVYLILSQDFPAIMAIVVLQGVSNDHDAGLIISRLAIYGRAQPASPKRWAILLNQLPADRLKKWYESPENTGLNLTYESFLLDEFIDEDAKKATLTDREKRDLALFRLAPGIPRVTYVLYGDEHDVGFAEATRAVLQDKTVLEMTRVLVAMRRRNYILENMKWKELGLSKQILRALETPATK